MDIRTLKSFLAVAYQKSFSAAARELNTVQPAVSRHISELENELGVSLFRRNTREVNITPAGESLLRDAKEILKIEKTAKERAGRAARGETGRLRIGYLSSASFTFLPGLVRRYSELYPDVAVSIHEMTVKQQAEAFKEGWIDLGISRPLPEDMRRDYISENVYMDSLIAVVPQNHRLAKKPAAGIQEFSSESFILFARNEAPGLFDRIINLCSSRGFSPDIRSQPGQMQNLLLEVSAGLGVSIVPGCIRRLYTEGCSFIPLKEPGALIATELHYRREPLLPAVRSFSELVKEARGDIQRNLGA